MHPMKYAAAAALATAVALLPAAAEAAGGGVEVVKAGATVRIGHGATMVLTDSQRCVDDGQGGSTCKSVVDGNQPPGTVGIQVFGEAGRTLYSPLYIGSGRAARMTVTQDGATHAAQVVTLAGNPGYATGYAWVAGSADPADVPQVTVYDAAGTVLASS
jgi:hypothetical protein